MRAMRTESGSRTRCRSRSVRDLARWRSLARLGRRRLRLEIELEPARQSDARVHRALRLLHVERDVRSHLLRSVPFRGAARAAGEIPHDRALAFELPFERCRAHLLAVVELD